MPVREINIPSPPQPAIDGFSLLEDLLAISGRSVPAILHSTNTAYFEYTTSNNGSHESLLEKYRTLGKDRNIKTLLENIIEMMLRINNAPQLETNIPIIVEYLSEAQQYCVELQRQRPSHVISHEDTGKFYSTNTSPVCGR